MAGHSKWANIKHQKAAQDKKRGKVFTKILKEVSVAARMGGGDPESNPRLRLAVQQAKKQNVPKDNIEKAIKKATGAGATDISEITYEGYGPSGVALYVEAATDNGQRTVANVRSYFSKSGGSLGKDGCLQFIFEQKAVFQVALGERDEDELTLELIDQGAEDVDVNDGMAHITGPREAFGDLQKFFEAQSIEPESGALERIPLTTKDVDLETFKKVMKLIQTLEDDEDVQKVYHNLEFNEDFIAHL